LPSFDAADFTGQGCPQLVANLIVFPHADSGMRKDIITAATDGSVQ
jgi:hypothetical protein